MPTKTSTPTIVFDLDGTLVDSVRDLVPALNHTIALEGLPPVSIAQIHPEVSKGARMMIRIAFDLHAKFLSAEKEDQLFHEFLKHYEEYLTVHTVFFDGCLAALDQLSQKGWKLAVCTNKHEMMGRKLLSQLGELDRFESVTGGDTFAFKKPDPRHITETIQLAGGTPGSAIMVGDSFNDIQAAKAANIPVIAVDFGYTDVPVDQLEPDRIISHFSEFVSAAEHLLDRSV